MYSCICNPNGIKAPVNDFHYSLNLEKKRGEKSMGKKKKKIKKMLFNNGTAFIELMLN